MGVTVAKPANPLCGPPRRRYTHVDGATASTENIVQYWKSATVNNQQLSKDAQEQIGISSQIDKTLQKDRSEDLERVKILLLGGADAGKSTIAKQMRIIHMNGFGEEELRSYRAHQINNLLQISYEVAVGIEDNEDVVRVQEKEKKLASKFAEGLSWVEGLSEDKKIEFLTQFYAMECVRSFIDVFPDCSALSDNAHYYLPKISELLAANYLPTRDDILHLRVPTTSVSEINFQFSETSIRLIDVGGQRTYRKKWIHFFDGVAAVMFVASMAAYDQSLDAVDSSTNSKPVRHNDILSAEIEKPKKESRLRDSAHLFGEMLRSKFLSSAAFILFLNKRDLFVKKLPHRPLKKFVHNYTGTTDKDAEEFLKKYFLKRKSKNDQDRKIYSHYTCATDTKNVDFVFRAACDIALKENLVSSGVV